MQVAHIFIHHLTLKQLREPMINPSEHTIQSGNAHNQVKVCHYEIGVVNIDIQGTVPKDYPGKSTGDKCGNKTDREQHCRVHLQITLPDRCNPVKSFYCRWNSNQQCGKGKYRAQKWVHTRYKHVMPPYDG